VNGKPRKHPAWENNPAIDTQSPVKIVDSVHARPYISHWTRWHGGAQIVFNPNYHARAGKIHLTPAEYEAASRFVPDEPFAIVEPIVRPPGSQNKDWGFDKWKQVIKDFPIPVFQFKVGKQTRILQEAKMIEAPNFRISAGIIEQASLVMTVEGGMHHLAASMGTPAVVVFGGFIDPEITGYTYQKNFYIALPDSPCGRYAPCSHCKKAMNMIGVEEVRQEAMKIIEEVL